jgi:TetR/AcrR family transcriptional repressor of nem operon
MSEAPADTKQKILDVARVTVQARGYAGLSFRELAKAVGIKSSSVHYYFPSKGELGGALAHRYTDDFGAYLDGLLTQGLDQSALLRKYTDVFRDTLRNENRMCLGGIMAAEHTELPVEVQTEVFRFSEMNIDWLARVLSMKNKGKASEATIRLHAMSIFAAVEGAQLVSRGRDDIAVYENIVAMYRTTGLLP